MHWESPRSHRLIWYLCLGKLLSLCNRSTQVFNLDCYWSILDHVIDFLSSDWSMGRVTKAWGDHKTTILTYSATIHAPYIWKKIEIVGKRAQLSNNINTKFRSLCGWDNFTFHSDEVGSFADNEQCVDEYNVGSTLFLVVVGSGSRAQWLQTE